MISSKVVSSALANAKGSGRCKSSEVNFVMGSIVTTSGVARSLAASPGCDAIPNPVHEVASMWFWKYWSSPACHNWSCHSKSPGPCICEVNGKEWGGSWQSIHQRSKTWDWRSFPSQDSSRLCRLYNRLLSSCSTVDLSCIAIRWACSSSAKMWVSWSGPFGGGRHCLWGKMKSCRLNVMTGSNPQRAAQRPPLSS